MTLPSTNQSPGTYETTLKSIDRSAANIFKMLAMRAAVEGSEAFQKAGTQTLIHALKDYLDHLSSIPASASYFPMLNLHGNPHA
jgi:hypothetical protein